MLNKTESQAEKREQVVIKKYANRRLYNTETSTYVTLDDLAQMVRSDRDFVVYDAKSGDDLTHSVLTQIIVEQEGREGGQTLLPIPFLRQLIRFYDDSIGRMVPSYLQFSLETLAKEQEKFRNQFANAFGNPAAAFEAYQEQARKNMAMFEQALSMWSPFGPMQGGGKKPMPPNAPSQQPGAPSQQPGASEQPAKTNDELGELKAQLAAMQEKIEKFTEGRN
ncbi:MAG TPA: polyhydroxyalkanoate synthesis repressor PhaR [Hyphomicrobiaceae bacterium]|nr:polyhydroxyalkanoate synthesis repressor PhaR [Hyphomicrobiaceae bacterium]